MMQRGQGKTGPFVEVIHSGGVAARVYLDEPGEFSIPEFPRVVFEVRDGAAAFIYSTCPDQVCVHTGWLSRPGHIAACLPNGLLLVVDGDDPNRPDTVVR
jgi:hypothetical protein